MKNILLFTSLFFVISCGNTGVGTRAFYDASGAAVGGALANQLSDGDPLLTAAGAAAGVGVAEIAQSASKGYAARQAQLGYEKGTGDNTKDLYWATQRRDQLFDRKVPERTRRTLYEVEVENTEEGVDKDPQTILIPIEEPR